jgi:hypothetical protein
MKHKSSLYFDDVVNYLVNTHAQLRMEDLAVDLHMTTETLRRKRKGVSILDCSEVEVLYRKYSINPMYFFGDRNILQAPNELGGGYVKEPEAVYQTKLDSCEKENKLLREMIDMLKKPKK